MLVGVISGIVVVHLVSGPKFSYSNMNCDKKNDKVDITISFHNIGESPAEDVKVKYIWINANTHKSALGRYSSHGEVIEPMDQYFYTIKNIEYEDNNVILCFILEYSDPSLLRHFFNKMFGKSYKKERWMKYDFHKNGVRRLNKTELDTINRNKDRLLEL